MSINPLAWKALQEEERRRNTPPSAEYLAAKKAIFKAMQLQFGILKQGVAVWNQWRKANPTVIPSLSGWAYDFGEHHELFEGVDLRGEPQRGKYEVCLSLRDGSYGCRPSGSDPI